MKKILFLLLFAPSLFGQKKDSLLRLINSPRAVDDTLMCRRYVLLIDSEVNIDGWIGYNTKMGMICNARLKIQLPFKEKLAYINFLGIFYNNLGIINSNKKQLTTAEKYYQIAIKLHKTSGDDYNLSIDYQNLAITYNRLGMPEKNIEFSKKALQICENRKDSTRIAAIYGDIGYVTADNGAVNLGVEIMMKSIKMSEKIKDVDIKMRTLKYLVRILTAQKEHEKALYYLKILNQYFKEKNAIESLSLNHFATASVFNLMGDSKEMFKNINTSLKYARKENLESTIASNYGLLAKYYLNIAQIDSAFKYSNLELGLRKINNSEPALTKSIITNVAILNQKKEYSKAKDLGLTAYENSRNIANLEMIMNASNNLKQTFKQLNNRELEAKYANIESSTKDSLEKLNTKNSAIKAVFKYESEQQETKIELLSQERQISELESKRKSSLIYSILGGILALCVIAYFSFTRFKEKKANELLINQLQEAENKIVLEQKATESELKALKSQMNPHFMFNALNSIQEQFMYGDKTLANEQMGNFTYLTRQILTVSGKKKINLATEVEILTKYLELEKMRFAEGFDYSISLSENIDEDYHQIPPMLIQPFVENSIKHGLLHKAGEKKLSVNFTLDEAEENLICVVEDNGVGRAKSSEIKSKQMQQHESFSTSATEERLKLLGNDLKTKDFIVYEDLQNAEGQVVGTRVRIMIALG